MKQIASESQLRPLIIDILKYQGDMLPSQVSHRIHDECNDSELCKSLLVQLVEDGFLERKPIRDEHSRLKNQYDDFLYSAISKEPNMN